MHSLIDVLGKETFHLTPLLIHCPIRFSIRSSRQSVTVLPTIVLMPAGPAVLTFLPSFPPSSLSRPLPKTNRQTNKHTLFSKTMRAMHRIACRMLHAAALCVALRLFFFSHVLVDARVVRRQGKILSVTSRRVHMPRLCPHAQHCTFTHIQWDHRRAPGV
ncbi:hypothetical protein DFJ77DRAFT_298229 [Powellomyces hirtus]|nr:hypothetical protein DFJ77DRAFT_298229 [Powellomyces hirtus]